VSGYWNPLTARTINIITCLPDNGSDMDSGVLLCGTHHAMVGWLGQKQLHLHSFFTQPTICHCSLANEGGGGGEMWELTLS
jgi:hypothetical protein